MTRYLLVRHAAADHVGRRIAGREPGVGLNGVGKREAAALAALLASELASSGRPARGGGGVVAVYSSPLERAMETAEPVADALGVEARVSPAFNEVDFGEWTGRSMADLEGDARWGHWNEARSVARAPGGESMVEVLDRALRGLRQIGARHGDGAAVVIVSHCDVIRPLLTHFLGMPLDHLLRLEVGTASVSTVELADWGARVLEVNRGPRPAWSAAGE